MARWSTDAFGLTFAGGICVLGLSQHGAPASVDLPGVELEAVETIGQVEARALVAGTPGGLVIESLRAGGYRMSGRGMGCAKIEPDIRRVLIEPPRGDRWLWNRWVLGQVLPFVAALHGRELLHAAGAVVGGGAVAILGPSGRGKSTLLAALLDGGAAFLSDDVLALTPLPHGVLAHPGPGVVGLPEPAFHTAAAASQLSTLCLLELADRDGVHRVSELPPADLLSSTYDRVRRGSERLAGQLSLLADVSARSRLIRIQRGRRSDVQELARALLAELGDE